MTEPLTPLGEELAAFRLALVAQLMNGWITPDQYVEANKKIDRAVELRRGSGAN